MFSVVLYKVRNLKPKMTTERVRERALIIFQGIVELSILFLSFQRYSVLWFKGLLFVSSLETISLHEVLTSGEVYKVNKCLTVPSQFEPHFYPKDPENILKTQYVVDSHVWSTKAPSILDSN